MSDVQPFAASTPQSLPMPERTRAVLTQQWHQLAEPGAWWTGQQRIDIANVGRAARRDLPEPEAHSLNEVDRRAATLVSTDAGSITEATVEGFVADGLSPEHYVELVGIISRTTAIDTATIGLGNRLEPYPDAIPGAAHNTVVPGAKRRSAWVPMVGGAGATSALSAVPAEDRAQEQLHGALYLSYPEMGSYGINKGLDRTQMELLAARTSLLNDCYF